MTKKSADACSDQHVESVLLHGRIPRDVCLPTWEEQCIRSVASHLDFG